MARKVLVVLSEQWVAARFDLSTEILIARVPDDGAMLERKDLVLAHASAEDLCQLILNEHVDDVICGGIEEEFLSFLKWKKVRVLDSVIGPWKAVLKTWAAGDLECGSVVAVSEEC